MQEAHRELRKEVPLSPLLRKPQTCARSDVARQPPTSISFETRCACSPVEWNTRLKAQERQDVDAWWCLLMVVNLPGSWGSLLTGSAPRQVMGSDGPYTYQILEGFFFFLKLIYTAEKKTSLPFRNYQAIKHNYSMAPGKTCVVMVKWYKMKEFSFLSYCSRYFITVRNREREKTKGQGLLDHGLFKKRRKVNIKATQISIHNIRFSPVTWLFSSNIQYHACKQGKREWLSKVVDLQNWLYWTEGGISLFSVDQRNDCNDEFKRVSWASRRVKSEVSRDFCIPAHHLSFHNSKTLLFIHIGRHLETSGLKRCLIYDSACNTHSHLVLTGGSSFS